MSYDLLFFRLKKGADMAEALRLFGADGGGDDDFSDEEEDEEDAGDDAGDDEEVDPESLPFDLALEEGEIVEQLAAPYLSALVPPEERSTELMKWLKAAESAPRNARNTDRLPDEAREMLEFMPMSTPGVYMLEVGGGGDLGPALLALCSALKRLAARGIYVLDPQMGMLMPENPKDEYYDIDETADDGVEDDEDED